MPGTPVPITGRVLEWALTEQNLTPRDAARRLNVGEQAIQDWIAQADQPNLGQFRDLAKLLGRPQNFFFLPEPPPRTPIQASFRTYAASNDRPGDDTVKALALARRIQRTMLWIRERSETDQVKIPSASRNGDPEDVGARLSRWLGWKVAAQVGSDSTDANATRAFRAVLQDKLITVLNLTMDEDVTRGFCLHDSIAPVIAVNTREGPKPRLFSYAHELAHLTLGSDSVCKTSANQGVEQFCNRVAGALLLPAPEFRDYVRSRIDGKVASVPQVQTIANRFRVSLRAAAIRLEHLGLAADGLYDLVDREAERRPGGRYVPGNERTRSRIRVDQYGHGFVNALLEAEARGYLRRSQVLDMLRVSDGELRSVRELAIAGADV